MHSVATAPDGSARDAPYLGPRPFERGDRPVFFGRDGEVRELVSLVVAHRVVLLYAASGAGKTSLLNAGLIPQLEAESFELLPSARLRTVVPDAGPEVAIDNVYVFGVVSGWSSQADGVEHEAYHPRALSNALAARPHRVDREGFPALRVVIFDQFEELFSLYPERWRDRAPFIDEVAAALEEDPLLRVVLALREDYLAELDAHASLLPGALRHRFRLERLGEDAALAAITRPIESTDRSFASGVAEKLVSDLRRFRAYTDGAGAVEVEGEFIEPVQLQVVCQSLWSELPSDVTEITEEHLRTFGDVNEVLARFYDDAVSHAAAAARIKEARLRRLLEQAFLTPGGTRGTVYRGATLTGDIPNSAIDELENRHLIRAEWRARGRWYELTHDRLVGPVEASNTAFAAAATRKRIRRLATLVAALVLVGAVAALAFILTPSTAPAGCTSCSAQFTQVSLETDVTRREYLNLLGLPSTGFTAAELARRGVLVRAGLELRRAKGADIRIGWSLTNATGERLARDSATTIHADHELDSLRLPIWVPIPRRSGTFAIELQASAPPQPRALDTFRTASFAGLSGEGSIVRAQLRVQKAGSGSGRVTALDLDCGTKCTATYAFGTQLTLEAVPGPGSRFVRWKGACGQAPTCTIVVGPITTIRAEFARVVSR